MLYEDMLRILGYDVRTISDGLSAINQIELLDAVPDLIVLDVNLPRLSGRDVLKHILRRDQLKNARIIVVTANNLMADEMRPLLREGDHFFLKPVRMTDLRRVVAEVRPKVDVPDYMADTVETEAVQADDAAATPTIESPLPRTEEAQQPEVPGDDDVYIEADDATIVNRSGMLWLKNALAEAAAKKEAEEAAEQDDATAPERPQETSHESQTGD